MKIDTDRLNKLKKKRLKIMLDEHAKESIKSSDANSEGEFILGEIKKIVADKEARDSSAQKIVSELVKPKSFLTEAITYIEQNIFKVLVVTATISITVFSAWKDISDSIEKHEAEFTKHSHRVEKLERDVTLLQNEVIIIKRDIEHSRMFPNYGSSSISGINDNRNRIFILENKVNNLDFSHKSLETDFLKLKKELKPPKE